MQEPLTDETRFHVLPTPRTRVVKNESAVENCQNAGKEQDDYDYPPTPKRLTKLIQKEIDVRSPSNPPNSDGDEGKKDDEEKVYVNAINHC